jgi:hypothetical protein
MSSIESVTVYRRGALITRVADLGSDSGSYPAAVEIPNLPLALSDASLEVRVRRNGAEGNIPIATDVKVGLNVGVLDETLAPPTNEELKTTKRRAEALGAELNQLVREAAIIAKLKAGARAEQEKGTPPAPSPTAARLALIEFGTEFNLQISEQIRQTREQLDRVAKQLTFLEERAINATNARQAREHELRKCAIVSLESNGVSTERVQIVLQYFVPGARWAPSYSVRMNRELNRASLFVRAMVKQRTGEDWSGVKLTLSTAEAQRWTELPELKAIRIGKRQPPPKPRWRPPPTGVEELYVDHDETFSAPGDGDVSPPTPEVTMEYALSADEDFSALSAGGMPEFGDSAMMDDEACEEIEMPTPLGGVPVPTAAPARSAPAMLMSAASMPPPQSKMAARVGRALPVAPSRRRVSAGAPMPGAMTEAQPPVIDADENLLRYGSLRMPGSNEPRRGHLVLSKPEDQYLELLMHQRIDVTFSVMHTIQTAVRLANQAERQAAPKRHRYAAPEAGFDYAYPASSLADIPSDGGFHSILVDSNEGDLRRRFIVVPRETQDVFRVVEMKNPLDAPLLPGPADVYVGGDYVLTTDLKSTPGHGTMEFGLGVEQAIKVSRNTIFEEHTAGLIRGSLDLQHEILIKLTNHLESSASVEVRERIPVTQKNNDDVNVTINSVEPEWKSYEQKDAPIKGGYQWTVSVPPSESTQLKANYTIRISSSDEIRGGNRREA